MRSRRDSAWSRSRPCCGLLLLLLQLAQPCWAAWLDKYDTAWHFEEEGLSGAKGRRLLQAAEAPAPVSTQAPASPAVAPGLNPDGSYAAVSGVQGQPSATTIYTLVNNNAAEFGQYQCIDSCAHGNTCIWQNCWLWECNGTNPTHHYWVWEPDTGIIRNAATDSFARDPEICLDMCTGTLLADGACVVTAGTEYLNIGFRQCTGADNQVWSLQGTHIVNKYNGYCASAHAMSCGIWSNCNKAVAQTGQNNMIINVVAEKCDSTALEQQWTLGPAPNSTMLDWLPLNVSASLYAEVQPDLGAQTLEKGLQVVSFVAENFENDICLSIENQGSCQSSESNSGVLNQGTTVCVWQNALLLPCWALGSQASADQQWVYDNSTGLIVLALVDTTQNICLDLCQDNSFANGACSLQDNNVGWRECTGAPNQKWVYENGLLYNEEADVCLAHEDFCMTDYHLFLSDPAAASTTVDSYPLEECNSNVNNNPWAGLPYNGTAGVVGIKNVVSGPCDQLGNVTLRFKLTPSYSLNAPPDPVAPGLLSSSSTAPSSSPASSSSSSTGAVIGGVIGGLVALAAILGLILWQYRRRSRLSPAKSYDPDSPFMKGLTDDELAAWGSGSNHRRLYTVDSDILAPARSGDAVGSAKSGELLGTLSDWEINPKDITICKTPEGKPHELGKGAFGTVYKAMRFGVQPVAAKIMIQDSEKHITTFQREIAMLRGLRDNNVVLFLGACVQHGRIMLVTEFLPNGDLWNAISHATDDKFSWYKRGKRIAIDVARGLVHLHSRSIVHMDLKSPNILLAKDFTAKIADVGLARSVSTNLLTHMSSVGTIAWAAPELKTGFKVGQSAIGGHAITAKVDVFSFGVVLWEIVTGEDPSKTARDVRVPDECPPEVAQLIQDCNQDDPSKRPEMREVYDRLKLAANLPNTPVPTPGPTPGPTPPISRDFSRVDGQQYPQLPSFASLEAIRMPESQASQNGNDEEREQALSSSPSSKLKMSDGPKAVQVAASEQENGGATPGRQPSVDSPFLVRAMDAEDDEAAV